MTSDDARRENDWLTVLPVIAGATAVALLGAYVVVFHSLPMTERPDAWGQFGDFLGGALNPLISLFTLMVAVSVWRLQKKEVSETRLAMEEQSQTAEQQRREQRFFDLLNLYHQTLTTVEADGKFGKLAFRHWTSSNAVKHSFIYEFLTYGFQPHTARHRRQRAHDSARKALEDILNSPPDQLTENYLLSAWADLSPILDHYFRTVFSILREAKQLLLADRFRYVKLFRAQLSRDELAMLTMNLIWDEEGRKMQPLVAEYGLLKHLPPSPLRTLAEARLNPASFGRRWTEHYKDVPELKTC